MPVTVFVAPGPLVTMHNANLARGARVAVGHVRGALFVAGEHMVQLLAVVQRVVDFDGLATGVAEHGVDAFGLKRSDNRLGARHRLALHARCWLPGRKRLAFDGDAAFEPACQSRCSS